MQSFKRDVCLVDCQPPRAVIASLTPSQYNNNVVYVMRPSFLLYLGITYILRVIHLKILSRINFTCDPWNGLLLA